MIRAVAIGAAALVAAAPAAAFPAAVSKPTCRTGEQLLKRVIVKKKRDRHGRLRRRRVVRYRCAKVPLAPVPTPGVQLPGAGGGYTDPGTGGGGGSPTGGGGPSFLTVTAMDASGLQLQLSRSSLPSGPVSATFVNRGMDDHNLHIRQGAGPDTPLTPDVHSLETSPFDVQLAPGTYTLFCAIPGHEAAGMRATLNVL